LDSARVTGTVSVSLGSDGQPQFTVNENVAWDALAGSEAASALAAGADAICFGTLGQRNEPSRSTIRTLVNGAPRQALRILDINLRPPYVSTDVVEQSLALADVLKVNDAELAWLSATLGCTGDARAQMGKLAARYQLQCVACTRGNKGSLLFSKGIWSEHPGVGTSIVDTVGAGDAFTAALTLGLLTGCPLDAVNAWANQLASHVCAHAGAMPPVPPNLRLTALSQDP
jgi:fructokinase